MASPRQLWCSIFTNQLNASAQTQNEPKSVSTQQSAATMSPIKPATPPTTNVSAASDADSVVNWYLRISL